MVSGFTSNDVGAQNGRTFLVTGANTGLGFQTTKLLAARGATVIMACRSEPKAQSAISAIRAENPTADVRFMALDLADLGQVRVAASAVLAGPRLDVLVNNAGVMIPPRSLTAQGYELQFGVNHLGTFAFTGLIHGHVEDRILVTSSIAHKGGKMDYSDLAAERRYSKWSRYSMSKLANLLHMNELDRRLSAAGRSTIAVGCHPGAAMTELARSAPGAMRGMMQLTAPLWNSAAEGAWPTLQAATGADVRGGDYYGPQGLGEISGPSGKVKMTSTARDPAAAAELWQRSIALSGVDPGI